jgi:hypothetical protein
LDTKIIKGNGEWRKQFSIFYAWAIEKVESIIYQTGVQTFSKAHAALKPSFSDGLLVLGTGFLNDGW